MRCDRCQNHLEKIMPNIKNNDWLKLYHYFEHELNEGEITNETWATMTDSLVSLKPEQENILIFDKQEAQG